jgi:hypothetical protein
MSRVEVKCQLSGKYFDHLSLFDIAFSSQEVPLSTGGPRKNQKLLAAEKIWPIIQCAKKFDHACACPSNQLRRRRGASLSTHKAHFTFQGLPAGSCMHPY